MLQVNLAERSYPIHIGQCLLASESLAQAIHSDEVLVVTNSTVAPLYLEKLLTALSNARVETLVLSDGEKFKTLETFQKIQTHLLELGFSRRCTMVALGGGVIGDITGFAAACYQRGVDYVQVPTTLLAQVDSSVGGKTAVNHDLGKNMIGAFYQPQSVVIDIDTLKTLPKREFAAGLAEVFKYGLIWDADFYQWLLDNQGKILAHDAATLSTMIERCCAIKAEVVSEDEREQGLRAILNFGHTYAHAIETTLGHGAILHGEAVAIGICLALRLSIAQGLIHADVLAQTQAWLKAVGLPTEIPAGCAQAQLLEAMGRDKKKQNDTWRLIVLEQLGRAVVKPFAPEQVFVV